MLIALSLAHAVEGMWEPSQIPSRADDLRNLGFTGATAMFSDTRSGPLAAVVTSGGCTASFVSADGLLVTNHHCIGGMLQYASKDGEDLVHDGVNAQSRAEERPGGPAARIRLEVERADVTSTITRGLDKMDDATRSLTIESRTKAVVQACEKGGRFCRVAVYDHGARYEKIAAIELRDLRLVFVPPDSVGNYGDEIDNWHWPRHSGDFAFYRAYVGKDGKPADYAADNVPYKPKDWLTVSLDGVGPGSVVLTAGYPGRTSRFTTGKELEHAYSVDMPADIAEGKWAMELIDRVSAEVPDAKVRLSNDRSGIGNRLFYNVGVREGFARSKLVDGAKARDAALAAWIAADSNRGAEFGDVVGELDRLAAASQAVWQRDSVVGRLMRSDMMATAVSIARFAREREKPDADRKPGYQDRDRERTIGRTRALSAGIELQTERAWLARYLEQAAALPAELQVPELAGAPSVDQLLTTKLVDEAERVRLYDARWNEVSRSADPMLALAVKLVPYLERIEAEGRARSGAAQRLRPTYIAALREMQPGSGYADANSSFRVSYGTIAGYRPKDAVTYAAFTTLQGLAEKASEWPFNAPKALLDAIAAGKWGPYGKGETVPVNFISDLDTTGGNSGSPTLDTRGRLVGLLFDGNVEAIASDFVFDTALNRSIHCDIRYVLWYVDAVGHNRALLTELGLTPAF